MNSVSRYGFSKGSFVLILVCGVLGLLWCTCTVVKTFVRAQAKDREEILAEAVRGRLPIFDRNGIALAATIRSADIYVHPYRVENKLELARQLSEYLAIDFDQIFNLVNKPAKYAVVARGHDLEFASRLVRQINMPLVVNLHKTVRRKYHGFKSLDALVGKVGTDGVGLYGLEKFLDAYLSFPPEDTVGLRLTLDSEVQAVIEKVALEGLAEHRAKSVIIVVAKARDGEILGYGQVESVRQPAPKLALTELAFEPGSTFKPFTIAIALDNSNTRPNDVLFCEQGLFKFGRHKIKDVKPYGNLTVVEILSKSSNICSGKLGLRVDKNIFLSQLRRLGFGEKVFYFPAESKGILFSPKTFKDIDQFVTSFGQGIAVTPAQMLRAFSVFLNDGRVAAPKLVMEKNSVPNQSQSDAVISSATANAVKGMLINAVHQGTGKAARIDGLTIGGKTGTAQKIEPGRGGYVPGKYIASFLGFVDLGWETIIIYTIVDEPSNGFYLGGHVAAPLFRRVVEEMQSVGLLEKYSRSSRVLVMKSSQPEDEKSVKSAL